MPATQSKGLRHSLSFGLLSPIHVRKRHSPLAVINHHINACCYKPPYKRNHRKQDDLERTVDYFRNQ